MQPNQQQGYYQQQQQVPLPYNSQTQNNQQQPQNYQTNQQNYIYGQQPTNYGTPQQLSGTHPGYGKPQNYGFQNSPNSSFQNYTNKPNSFDQNYSMNQQNKVQTHSQPSYFSNGTATYFGGQSNSFEQNKSPQNSYNQQGSNYGQPNNTQQTKSNSFEQNQIQNIYNQTNFQQKQQQGIEEIYKIPNGLEPIQKTNIYGEPQINYEKQNTNQQFSSSGFGEQIENEIPNAPMMNESNDITLPKGVYCSFQITGNQPFAQFYNICLDCSSVNQQIGCCTACSIICHNGHRLGETKYSQLSCNCSTNQNGNCSCYKM
eukprot:gene11462-4626_t